MYPFDEFKDKYGKPMKRKFFNEGMEELEADRRKVKSGGDVTVPADEQKSNGDDLLNEEVTVSCFSVF